jgi:cell wall-associated NlpC family hydrolase
MSGDREARRARDRSVLTAHLDAGAHVSPARPKGGDAVNGTRRLTVPLLFLTSILILTLTFAPFAGATPLSEKRAKAREIAAKLNELYPKVSMAVERYNQAMDSLATVKQQIKENERMLKVAEYNLDLAQLQLETRAVSMYKSRDVGFVDVLFSTNSFDELVTQLDVMERLGKSDVDTMKSIASYEADVKDRRIKLDADKEAAVELVAEAKAQKERVEALEAKLERMQAGVRAQIRELREEQERQAEQAALQATGGGGDTQTIVVDPGGPGHPEVVAIAQRYLGVPYVYGGASPSGFDCSGFTMYCYAQIGIGLAHAATAQQQASTPVPVGSLMPGDLVFFGGPGRSYHVGIYVGGGTMIHAPHTGAVVSYGSTSGAWIGGRF